MNKKIKEIVQNAFDKTIEGYNERQKFDFKKIQDIEQKFVCGCCQQREGVDSSQQKLSHINQIFGFANEFKNLKDDRFEYHKIYIINKYGNELGIKLLNGVFMGMTKEQFWDCFRYKLLTFNEYIHESGRFFRCSKKNRKRNPTFVFRNDTLVDVRNFGFSGDEKEPEVELKAPYSHPKIKPLPI